MEDKKQKNVTTKTIRSTNKRQTFDPMNFLSSDCDTDGSINAVHWTKIDISLVLRGKEMCRTCSKYISFAWPALEIWYSHASFL